MTKAEWDKKEAEQRERWRKEEEEHEARIPELTHEWVAKGHEVLDEKYHEKWDECVPIRLGDLYRGMELGNCLDIVKALNEGCEISKAKEIIDSQGHSGMSYGLVRAMVKTFCDRGEEFCNYTKM